MTSINVDDRFVVSTSLISTGLCANNSAEAIHQLAKMLHNCGYVHDSFEQAVIDREILYPTGLPFPIGVAIPHTDSEHVIKSAIAIGVINNPVIFEEMGSHGVNIKVRIIFVLAMKESHTVMYTIQTLVKTLRDKMILEKIIEADNPETLLNVIIQEFPGLVQIIN